MSRNSWCMWFCCVLPFGVFAQIPLAPPTDAPPAPLKPLSQPTATTAAQTPTPSASAASSKPAMPSIIPAGGKLPPGAVLVRDRNSSKKKPPTSTGATAATAASPQSSVPSPPDNNSAITPPAPKPAATPDVFAGLFDSWKKKKNPATNTTARTTDSASGKAVVTAALPPPSVDRTDPSIARNPFELPALSHTDSLASAKAEKAEAIAATEKAKNKSANDDDSDNDKIAALPAIPRASVFKQVFTEADKNPPHFMLFSVIFALLIYLAFVFTVYRSQVNKVFSAFLNDAMLSQLYRENNERTPPSSWILYLLFFVTAGLFAYLVTREHHINFGSGALTSFALCTGGIALLILLKHTLLRIIAAIFPFYKEINLYRFTISVFHQALGLMLLPVVVFMAFAPTEIQVVTMYFGIAIVAMSYLMRSARGLIIASRYIVGSQFHFALYLCTVEVAPILILLRLVI